MSTPKVCCVHRGGVPFYASWARQTEEISDRPSIAQQQAGELLDLHERLARGGHVSYDDLARYRSGRLTWHVGGFTSCTCPAFVGSLALRCFHTVALDLAAGRAQAPPEEDGTPLMSSGVRRPGRRPRVGDCYAVQAQPEPPLATDTASLLRGYRPGGALSAPPLPKPKAASRRKRPPAAPRPAAPGAAEGGAAGTEVPKRRRLCSKTRDPAAAAAARPAPPREAPPAPAAGRPARGPRPPPRPGGVWAVDRATGQWAFLPRPSRGAS